MAIDARVKARAEEIITEGEALPTLQTRDAMEHRARCAAWIAAVLNITDQICDRNSQYNRQAQQEASQFGGDPIMLGHAVQGLTGILRNMVSDADAGLIGSVADRASAQTFDDFLDHGEAYGRDGRKNEAGVIAGVVFEDSVKRLCRKVGITVAEKAELEQLINALSSNGVLTGLQSKEAKVAAGVRTMATHANWDSFDLGQVESTIRFTRLVILPKLDA